MTQLGCIRLARVNDSHNQHNSSFRRPNILSTSTSSDIINNNSAGQSNMNILLLLVKPLGSTNGVLLSPFSMGGYVISLFSFIIFPTETGAKNKRPQARPRAKESVMIPTLLMNIPTPTTTKHNNLFANGSGFASFSLFFICSFTAAWKRMAAYIRLRGIEDGGAKKQTQQMGEKSGSPATLSFSRLVKSSPSFPSSSS